MVNKGAPGWCATCKRYIQAINSPQSQKLVDGSKECYPAKNIVYFIIIHFKDFLKIRVIADEINKTMQMFYVMRFV
jgi:hypothetical protein